MTSWNSSAIGRQCCHCAPGVFGLDQNKERDSASFDYCKTESQINISIFPEAALSAYSCAVFTGPELARDVTRSWPCSNRALRSQAKPSER